MTTWAYGWPLELLDEKLREAVYNYLRTKPIRTKELEELERLLGNWKPHLRFKDLKVGDRFRPTQDYTCSYELMKTNPVYVDSKTYTSVYIKGFGSIGIHVYIDDDTKVVKL